MRNVSLKVLSASSGPSRRTRYRRSAVAWRSKLTPNCTGSVHDAVITVASSSTRHVLPLSDEGSRSVLERTVANLTVRLVGERQHSAARGVARRQPQRAGRAGGVEQAPTLPE